MEEVLLAEVNARLDAATELESEEPAPPGLETLLEELR